jgi:tetrahydromethanopterin S-methyltransferase subunit B
MSLTLCLAWSCLQDVQTANTRLSTSINSVNVSVNSVSASVTSVNASVNGVIASVNSVIASVNNVNVSTTQLINSVNASVNSVSASVAQLTSPPGSSATRACVCVFVCVDHLLVLTTFFLLNGLTCWSLFVPVCRRSGRVSA